MTEKQEKLLRFLENPKNWRPPSLSSICEHMGWRSKNSAVKAIKKINYWPENFVKTNYIKK